MGCRKIINRGKNSVFYDFLLKKILFGVSNETVKFYFAYYVVYYFYSYAVVVGFLSLIGVATETAIVMIIYLEEAVGNLKVRTKESVRHAIYEGAVLRVRPKLMTVFAILGGLLPIMYIDGVGSEVMQRIAAPMIGGVVSSAILTLIVIPAIYFMVIKKKK